MILARIPLFLASLAAAAAWAQAPKSTEQQARSYILSAFMTGAAPAVLSDDVKVAEALRTRFTLSPESDSRAIYFALVRITAGKSLTVRPAKIDELERTQTQVEQGRPVFSLDVSDSTFVLKYDLERDAVTTVADASQPVAVTSPVSTQQPAQPIVAQAATATAEPAKGAAEPAPAAAPESPPQAAPGARVQVVEPQEPRFIKPAGRPALSLPEPLQATARGEPPPPPLKPNGACVIKPVMSDQDLANCGARLR
jgi:hypothetical protein